MEVSWSGSYKGAQGRGSRLNLLGVVRKEGGLNRRDLRSCEDKRCLFQIPEHILVSTRLLGSCAWASQDIPVKLPLENPLMVNHHSPDFWVCQPQTSLNKIKQMQFSELSAF